jgi:endoglycosylceramidase
MRAAAWGLSCLALLAACQVSESPDGTASRMEARATPLPLSADAAHVRDASGREVLMRGFNHSGLRSDRRHPPYRVDGQVTPDAELFELQDLEDDDFDLIASTGLNAMRLVVTWEFAQPDAPPAPYNEGYFRRIDAALAKAQARGIQVVLIFGQFGWSRDLGGNTGAPPWTSVEECRALPRLPAGAPPQTSPPVLCQWTQFWRNAPVAGQGLQDHYLALWRFVAQRYRGSPAIAAYDLLNEPVGGAIPAGVLEPVYLYPYYRRLAGAIRAIDPGRMVGFQPEVFHSAGVPMPLGLPIGIDNALYLPHQYTLAYGPQRLDPGYLPAYDLLTRTHIALSQLDARAFGTPLAWGEVGWFRTANADGVGSPLTAVDHEAPALFARDFTSAADAAGLGWLWFGYSSYDEAWGLNYDEVLDLPVLRELSRPYPRATAGRVVAFAYDPASRTYTQETQDRFDAPSEIALPLAWQYPDGACIRADGRPVARLSGDGRLLDGAGRGIAFDAVRHTLVLARVPMLLGIEPPGSDCQVER